MIDKFQETFKEEAYELLGQLEGQLLVLEKDESDKEALSAVFRSMHTIKGSAAMFGFDAISEFTHGVESVLDDVRNGLVPLSKRIIDLVLVSGDQIKIMLDSGGELTPEAESLAEQLREYRRDLPESHEKAAGRAREDAGERTYRISFTPAKDAFFYGCKPANLMRDLAELGEITLVPDVLQIPPMEDLNPEHLYLSWNIILSTSRPESDIREVFLFVEKESQLTVEMIDDLSVVFEEERYKRLGEILLETGRIKANDLKEILKTQHRLGELLLSKGLVTKAQLESALSEQDHVRKIRESRRAEIQRATLRVSSAKLDELVDLVGELVTLDARVSAVAQELGDSGLLAIGEQLERLTTELRDSTMGIRMLPIGGTFTRFARLVRDLSGDLGKSVALETHGGDTELDKTVLDKLGDPLVHLIRNSIDHGIETPAERKKAGKEETGTIVLSAVHSGAHVIISVKDDGAGLNLQAILAKARERGIVAEGANLNEGEIAELIFAPGFSTAGSVTSVSGRGVGMDVVKRQIEGLRGSVEIHSEAGTGTEIILRLPLTLVIIEGLLIRVEDELYVVPLAMVEECVELDVSERNNIASVRGEMISFLRLRALFGISGEAPKRQQMIVINAPKGKLGLVVDEVLGGHQTVIKSLGPLYSGIAGISGATILGDGTVALVLDINRFREFFNEKEA